MAGSEIVFESLVDPMECRMKAISHLNEKLGTDANNLDKIEHIVLQLQATKLDMEKKLQFVSSEAPDHISRAVTAAEVALESAELLHEEANHIQETHEAGQTDIEALLDGVEEQLVVVQRLQRAQAYHGWMRSIQQISCEMSTLLGAGNESKVMTRYEELQDRLHHLTSSHTACYHLHCYLHSTVTYWHHTLTTIFSQEFSSVLKGLKYPFTSTTTTASQPPPAPNLLTRLETLTSFLLQLHHPLPPIPAPSNTATPKCKTASTSSSGGAVDTSVHDISVSSNSSDFLSSASSSPCKQTPPSQQTGGGRSGGAQEPALLADFEPLITPLNLLLKPLQVRFLYHFSGNRKTNSRAHPEWCLTRVLNWLTAHASFYDAHIQPLLDCCAPPRLCAKTEVARGLVRLVAEKMSQDLTAALEDEDLFCHSLQETLHFERELRETYGYPASQPSVLSVLTQPAIFSYWIYLERKFAVAVMDEVVGAAGAWECDEGGGVSACGEQVVAMLQGITDRYKPLPQPGHRLQFLEVELDVLDEFRLRAVQLSRSHLQAPVTSHYPAILTTLHHLADTLTDWSDTPFFLELQMYREQQQQLETAAAAATDTNQASIGPATLTQDGGGGGVFDEVAALYRHVQEEMLAALAEHVLTEVRARFMPYRRDKWFLERPASEGVGRSGGVAVSVQDVSPHFCPLLEVLARQLQCLHPVLARPLYSALWQALARDLDKFLYEELVLQNNFSDLGAAQLEHDMTKALFTIFAEFTNKPENYFVHMKESVCLLRLPRATAFLLRDALRVALDGGGGGGAATAKKALAEHRVTTLSPHDAARVLAARTNMTII